MHTYGLQASSVLRSICKEWSCIDYISNFYAALTVSRGPATVDDEEGHGYIGMRFPDLTADGQM